MAQNDGMTRMLPSAAPWRPGDKSYKPVVTAKQAERHLQQLREFVEKCMVNGVDYGSMNGGLAKDGEKAVLLKPGAEKLLKHYGLACVPDLVDKQENWDPEAPFFMFRYKAVVTWPRLVNGELIQTEVAGCYGSANSLEAKYKWRTFKSWERGDAQTAVDLEKDGTEILKTGWNDSQRQWWIYRMPLELDQLFGLVNTMEKIAQKRALVGAVIQACMASALFTQDMDDIAQDQEVVDGPRIPHEADQAARPASAAAGGGGGGGKGELGESDLEILAAVKRDLDECQDTEAVNAILARYQERYKTRTTRKVLHAEIFLACKDRAEDLAA